MNNEPLSPLQEALLCCLVKKIIASLPNEESRIKYTYDISTVHESFRDHCQYLLQDEEVWRLLPSMIPVEGSDFTEVFAEIEKTDGEVVGIHLHHSSFTKEALKEEFGRYFNHFDTVSIVEDSADQNDSDVISTIFGESSSL